VTVPFRTLYILLAILPVEWPIMSALDIVGPTVEKNGHILGFSALIVNLKERLLKSGRLVAQCDFFGVNECEGSAICHRACGATLV
jgi:hypothetical protein